MSRHRSYQAIKLDVADVIRGLMPLARLGHHDENASRAQALKRCAQDMRMYALKHDAVRRELVSEEERTAFQRDLAAVAGEPTWRGRGERTTDRRILSPEFDCRIDSQRREFDIAARNVFWLSG